MKKKVSRKISKIIIKAITAIMAIVFVFAMCAADSEAWLPVFVVLLISGSWLAFIAWANGYIE